MMAFNMNGSERLAKFIVNMGIHDFDEDVIKKAELCIVDYLAASIYGTTKKWGHQITKYVSDFGIDDTCTVIGSAKKTNPQYAALANGTIGHGFELDDFHTGSFVHPGAVVIPAALSVAQKKRASGDELLTSIILGYEVMIQIGLILGTAHSIKGFHATGTSGPFASAAAAGKVMGLKEDQMINALGIAGSMASGLKEFYLEGSTVKRLHAGKASESGVSAALLTKYGFTGPSTVFEGKFGFFKTYTDSFDLEKLHDTFGQDWQIMHMNVKPYACCGGLHPTVTALNQFKKESKIAPDQIDEIVVEVTERNAMQNSGPGTSSVMSAQYSIPFCGALSLCIDIEDPSNFSEEMLKNPEVISLSKRIRVIGNPELKGMDESNVNIYLKNGKEFRKKITRPKGHPENPLSQDEVTLKFKKLASHVYSNERIEKILEILRNIRKLKDINILCNYLGNHQKIDQ